MRIPPRAIDPTSCLQGAATLASIARVAYESYVARIGRPPAPMDSDHRALVRDAEVLVLQDDAEAVGFVALMTRNDHLLLDNVEIRPDAQGRGIGSELLWLAEMRARATVLAGGRIGGPTISIPYRSATSPSTSGPGPEPEGLPIVHRDFVL